MYLYGPCAPWKRETNQNLNSLLGQYHSSGQTCRRITATSESGRLGSRRQRKQMRPPVVQCQQVTSHGGVRSL